jgi:hypothetical protein
MINHSRYVPTSSSNQQVRTCLCRPTRHDTNKVPRYLQIDVVTRKPSLPNGEHHTTEFGYATKTVIEGPEGKQKSLVNVPSMLPEGLGRRVDEQGDVRVQRCNEVLLNQTVKSNDRTSDVCTSPTHSRGFKGRLRSSLPSPHLQVRR